MEMEMEIPRIGNGIGNRIGNGIGNGRNKKNVPKRTYIHLSR